MKCHRGDKQNHGDKLSEGAEAERRRCGGDGARDMMSYFITRLWCKPARGGAGAVEVRQTLQDFLLSKSLLHVGCLAPPPEDMLAC